jgi:hypothetical protein
VAGPCSNERSEGGARGGVCLAQASGLPATIGGASREGVAEQRCA